ncbi:hypothetical protein [Agrobacterium tumefaciens]|uniref:Uncharacterized protein n=1 Tax=Agrobacterium tumefaciens TaxID=358 RepID=A0A176XFR4_AGRTU|nr:hypothetical protein [Agrobacterium tumefaciens]OAE47865.1 hypothetical protein A7J57_06460 [Agrobacterium tumefaciens]
MTKISIKKQSAHAGGGKSKTIFEMVVASDQPTIIATPTDKLSFQYELYFDAVGIKSTLISRKRDPEYPSRQHLLDAVKAGKKLIIVTQGIVHECAADLSAYRIFEDEIFNPLKIIKFEKAQYARPIFAEFLDAEISVSPRYYLVKLTAAAVEIAVSGWNHAVIKDSEVLLELCEANIDPNYDVYVLAESYNRYLSGKQNDIQFWVVLKPTVHAGRDVAIVGALFEDSLTDLIWSQSADFVDANFPLNDTGLTHNANLADIRYVSEKPLTGKAVKKATAQTVFKKAAEIIEKEYPNRKYIFGINKMPNGRDYPWSTEGTTATRLLVHAHGQTGYSDIDMAVYLATQYYDPATYKFLYEVFGIGSHEVWKSFTFDRFYQFALRICARNRDNTKPFTIVAPDRACAFELSRLFGCANEPRLLDLGIDEFREEENEKATPVNAKERQRKSRENRKKMNEDHENTHQYDQYRMIFWNNKYAKQLLVKPMPWSDIAEILEDQHQAYSPKNKTEAICFREGDIADEQNHKLVGNIRATKIVILDMDIVKRDPQDLSDFLAENGWSHLIFNSFSSTPLEPHIRVIIGLSEAVNPANYLRIVNLLKDDIDAKFGAGTYEIDGSKLTINNKFHSPSISQFKAPLFIKRNIRKDGHFELRFLDVRWFISRNTAGVSKPIAANTNVKLLAPVKEAIDDIIERFAVQQGEGKGSYNFHQAAVELKKADVSQGDCIAILTQHRHRFGHGADRDAAYTVGRVFGNSF